jgi:hypothetical protein
VVLWDTTILSLALHPDAKYERVTDPADRVKFMLEGLQQRKEGIIIPTPVLAEFLVLTADDAPKYLTEIKETSVFRIQAFDERAAIELADMELKARASGSKRGSATGEWQKIKIDRQIVAIGRVLRVSAIYSTDPDISALATDTNIRVISVENLPLPPAKAQTTFTELTQEVLPQMTDAASSTDEQKD